MALVALDADPGVLAGVDPQAFYEACGFRALQAFPWLWDPEDPALQLVKHLAS